MKYDFVIVVVVVVVIPYVVNCLFQFLGRDSFEIAVMKEVNDRQGLVPKFRWRRRRRRRKMKCGL